jgi:hypothetical protein
MPISVQCVLTTSEGVELTKLAEIADRILDHSAQTQVIATVNPRNEPPTSSQQPTVDFSEEKLANAEKQLSNLTTFRRMETGFCLRLQMKPTTLGLLLRRQNPVSETLCF